MTNGSARASRGGPGRTRTVPLLLLVPALPSLLACPGQRLERLRERETAEARAAFAANLDAIRRRDVEAYLAGYLASPDFLFLGPGGAARGFAPFAAARRTDPAFPDSLAAGESTLTWVAPGVVHVAYPYVARQGAVLGHGWSERILVKTAEGWKIAVTGVIPAN